MLSGICVFMPKHKLTPLLQSFFLKVQREELNFRGRNSECYQYTSQTINATSQTYSTDFELAKKLHINELTKHENIQNSVGKLRGLPKF